MKNNKIIINNNQAELSCVSCGIARWRRGTRGAAAVTSANYRQQAKTTTYNYAAEAAE